MAAGSTYTPIATTTLGSAQATVTFSSLGSYTDIILVINPTTTAGGGNDITLRFNGDSATNYSWTNIAGNGSAASSTRSSGASYIAMAGYPTGWSVSSQGVITAHIQNYSNATTYKTALIRSSDNYRDVGAYVGLWRNTAAITSITLGLVGYTYAAGSTFTLYGIAAA